MKSRELHYSVEIDMKINQLRSILSSLTDDDKSSYLDRLKQIDKESVDFLIENKKMNPYSDEMLDQLDLQLKQQHAVIDYDTHILNQKRDEGSLINELLTAQGFHIEKAEHLSEDELLVYSLNYADKTAVYHPSRLALQACDNHIISAQRYMQDNKELLLRLHKQREAQKEQACVNRSHDKKRDFGANDL